MLDCKESWAQKNWCFWTVVSEKTFESPLDWKDIQPVHPKGNQSWIFFGRTDAEAKAPVFWPSDAKSWVIGKHPHAGKDWRQEEKGITEDEMVGWHHQLHGHECEQAPGVGDEQGSLACCSPWGHRVLRHNWATELNWKNKRSRGRQRMRWLDSITNSMNMISEQTPEDSEGQGSLACCSPWGRKKLDMT